MPATITVTGNQELAGLNILVEFDSSQPTGTGTLFRVSSSTITPVRGFIDVPYTSSYDIVDTEIGLDATFDYLFAHFWGSGASQISYATALGVSLASYITIGDFVLRNQFLPLAAASVVKNVQIGTIQDVSVNIRSTEFSVLGRSDPVVVVDTVDSTRSRLLIETETVAEREAVKTLLRYGDPLLLQSRSSYDMGTNGVLYFQPKKYDIKRLTTFGERPERRFEIEYVETRLPSSAIVFDPPTFTYTNVDDDYDAYTTLIATTYSYFRVLYGFDSTSA